ncbi:MAG: imidazole glycerol phosphate synthase subunit HisF [Aureispira sp.]
MVSKRIIPCLDIKNGRTVKGINFKELRDAGDPIALAQVYAEKGADELVFLDITASQERRGTLVELVEEIAAQINIPFTVGGGIRTVEDVSKLLQAGADKVTINSAAVNNPVLISEVANRFGRQCLVVAIDAQLEDGTWWVYTQGGRKCSEWQLLDWAQEAERLGAGELLFTSMSHDGTKAGFATEALALLSKTCSIPVIASGGAGSLEHFKEAFEEGKADAALAASVFHFGEITISDLKNYLAEQNIAIRL